MKGVPGQIAADAIIFRTHFWDAFAQRQFERLQTHARGCDVFVLVDETGGKVGGIAHDRVVRVSEASLLGMGLARAGEGNLLWFNGDYPLYGFMQLCPGYERYLQLEYDVVVNIDLAALLARLRADEVDFLGLSKGEPASQWYWLPSCMDLYRPGDLRHQLICFSVFSAAALRHLWRRRLEHTTLHRNGTITAWPMCEGFIATELATAGFRVAELSQYGDTQAYDHWPPYLEADLPALQGHDFIHPLLDEDRFVASMMKYQVGIGGFLRPDSLFHRKLRRLPARRYARALVTTFASKVSRVLRDLMAVQRTARKAAS
jgi:hypothetical protein